MNNLIYCLSGNGQITIVDFTDPNSEPNTESNPKPNTELQVTQVGNYSSKQKPQKMCRTVLSRKTIRVHPDQLSETSMFSKT